MICRNPIQGKGPSGGICEGTTVRTYSPRSSGLKERYRVHGEDGLVVLSERTTAIHIKGMTVNRRSKEKTFQP